MAISHRVFKCVWVAKYIYVLQTLPSCSHTDISVSAVHHLGNPEVYCTGRLRVERDSISISVMCPDFLVVLMQGHRRPTKETLHGQRVMEGGNTTDWDTIMVMSTS